MGDFPVNGQATFLRDGIKGRPALDFNGSSDGFVIEANAATTLNPGSRNFAMVAVVSPNFEGFIENQITRVVAGSLAAPPWSGFALTAPTCAGPNPGNVTDCRFAFGMEMNLNPAWAARQVTPMVTGSEHIVHAGREGDDVILYDKGMSTLKMPKPSGVGSSVPSNVPFEIGKKGGSHRFAGKIAELWLFIDDLPAKDGASTAAINESKCVAKALQAKYRF
jgi:hypothetical protein